MICGMCGADRPHLQKHHLKLRIERETRGHGEVIYICANCHEDQHRGPEAPLPQRGWERPIPTHLHTPEANAHRAERVAALHQDPNWRAWFLARVRAGNATKRGKKYPKITAAQKGIRRTVRTAEGNAKTSESLRKRWAEPEQRLKWETALRGGAAKKRGKKFPRISEGLRRTASSKPPGWHTERAEAAAATRRGWSPERRAAFEKLASEVQHHSDLTEADVRDIRARYVPRKVTQASLAEEYGVSKATIGDIVSRRTWRHID